MSKIAYKSTGFLMDEFITNSIKIRALPESVEVLERADILINELLQRLSDREDYDKEKMESLIKKLERVLKVCWDAQEDVMRISKITNKTPYDYKTCALSAIKAQRYNAKRNKIIREIDELLDELDRSVTEKTYA